MAHAHVGILGQPCDARVNRERWCTLAGNILGTRFRIATFGESHGPALGVVIDGCPAGLPFPHARVRDQLARRRPGQSHLTTQRNEGDVVELLSGVHASGVTLGTPIAMIVRNCDARSTHYDDLEHLYRPSHADYTYDARFGVRAVEGGGRASARETVARVAAGAVAEALLAHVWGAEVVAWVDQVGDVVAPACDGAALTREAVDASPTRCPDLQAASNMQAHIEAVRKTGDSVGGRIRCVARDIPAGIGAPVFDKLTAELAKALMSLPAARGFEVGEGMAAAAMRGSTHNDAFVPGTAPRPIRTLTNYSGGLQGGMTNGETIEVAVAFKPVATIFVEQQTVDRHGQAHTYKARGRHDPCVVPRAVPMVEAMVALTLCDHMLITLGAKLTHLDALRPHA